MASQTFFLATLVVVIVTISALNGSVQAYTAPSTLSKFTSVLSKSKLQAPSSGTAATSSQLLNGFNAWYFYLQGGSYMQFQMNGSKKRSELREMQTNGANAHWSVTSYHNLDAEIAIPSQASGLSEVTFLQVHCNNGNTYLPALRVSWRSSYSENGQTYNDAIISTIRTGTGSSSSNFDKDFLAFRSTATKSYRVRVNSSKVTVWIDGSMVLDKSISFWQSYGCNFKAGAYVTGTSSSSAKARIKFKELTW